MRKIWLNVGRWAVPATIAIAGVAVMTSTSSRQNAIGQQQPPAQDDPGPRGPGDHGPGPADDHDTSGPGGGMDGGPDGRRHGPGGPGGMVGRDHEMGGHDMGHDMGASGHGGPSWSPTLMPPQMQQVERLKGYLELVDRFRALANDPAASGIAAVITAGDVLRPRGPEAAIQFYNDILPKVSDPAIQRAIHTQLAEMYRAANKPEQSIDELAYLMTGKVQDIKLPPATTQPSR